MARVRVSVDDLERGDVPALSVKTGVACAHPVVVVLRPEQTPLSPLGRKITAVVPLEPARSRNRRRLTRISWVLLVAAAAAFVAALTGAGSAVLLAALVALVAYGTLVGIGELRWIGARPSTTKDEIVLTRVHPSFAHAVDEQYGR